MNDPLFEISEIHELEGKLNGSININKDHAVFSGHFPGNPVLPGACQLNLISDILQAHFQKPYQLKQAKSLKFTHLVNPLVINRFNFELNYIIDFDTLLINGRFAMEDKIIFKFSLNYAL